MATVKKPDAAHPRKVNWTRIFRVTAEVSAIASLLAFALSCMINSYVFSAWNHNFLQLATPVDVIMSGMRIIGSIIGPIALAFGLSACVILYMLNEGSITVVISKIPDRHAGLRNTLSKVRGIFLILIFLAWAAMFVYALGQLSPASWTLSPIVEICMGLFMLSIGLIGGIWEAASPGPDLDSWGMKIFYWSYMALSIVCGGILTTQWFSQRVANQTMVGFHHEPLAVLRDGLDICGGGSRLLWSGSQSSLFECPTTGGRRVVLVQRNEENVSYVPRRYLSELSTRTKPAVPQ